MDFLPGLGVVFFISMVFFFILIVLGGILGESSKTSKLALHVSKDKEATWERP